MDTNNWTNQGGTGGGDSTMESVDWRPQFSAEQRQKIVNRIIQALTKYSSYGPEKLHEIKNIASMVEDKFYTTSPSQYEYMKKISLKLLNISKSANPISSGSSVNPSDPGSQGMQQVNNQGQPLPTHVPSNHPQSSQQILSSALPPGGGLEQSTMSNITTQNPNLQNIQNISRVQVQQSYVGNSMPNNFVNQRQIPGRQQQQQQQQQQSQNSQQLFYRHQLQQIAKHNLQQSFSATSAQSHIQQQHQNLLQPGHFQPSSLSTGQQSQQPVIQSSLRQQQRQQPQQQPRVLSNGQQPHQHSVGQQHNNNFSHVGPQSSSSQLLGTTQQHSTHVMQLQSKVSIPQQNNQSMKGQLQQQVMPQLQTQSGGQLKSNMSQRDMQQRIATSGGFQQQNVIVDQQKQVFQQQRAMPEASSTSSDSTAQTGNQNSGDWQEEVYQKIKAMRDKYMPDLKELYPKIVSKLHQLDSLPNQPKSEQFQNIKMVKQVNEHCMAFLQLPKTNITLTHKEKLALYEKQIVNILTTYNRKAAPTTHPQQPQSSPMFQLHMQQQLLQKQQLLQQHHKNHHHHHHHHNNRHNNNNNTVTKQQLQAIQQLPHIGVKLEPSSLHRLKPGPPFSPNIDHLLTCVTKSGTGTPANSPFTMSSPSTPSTSHVVGGDSEKVVNSSLSLPNQSNVATLPTPIGTPGISASPLLAEFASPDENHGNDASVVSGKSSTVEQPIEHLLKVVKSISAKSLSASVSDIGSVVSMIDSIAGPGAGNNASRAAIGEDLVATTKCRLQETNNTETRKRKRLLTSEMHLNVVSSVSSVNDSFKHFNGLEASELESTATSNVIRPRIQTSNALLEEIRGINRGLIDTMVDIDADSAACSDVGKGTVVKCLFGAVALGPNLKSQYSSAKVVCFFLISHIVHMLALNGTVICNLLSHNSLVCAKGANSFYKWMNVQSPIQPLRLLVPENYPHCSPLLLDKFPLEVSKEYDDLSIKAKWRFCSCMRTLSEPMSLEEMARTWDVCARAVISDYAQQSSGGGTFTSKYGAWEDCIA